MVILESRKLDSKFKRDKIKMEVEMQHIEKLGDGK